MTAGRRQVFVERENQSRLACWTSMSVRCQMRLRQKNRLQKRISQRNFKRSESHAVRLTYKGPMTVRTPPSESINPPKGEFFTLYQMVEPMGVEPTASRVRFRSRAKPAIQQKPAVTIKAQVTERLFARFVHPSQHGSWASCVSVPAQFPHRIRTSLRPSPF